MHLQVQAGAREVAGELKAPSNKKKLSAGECLYLILSLAKDQKTVNARWEFYRRKGRDQAREKAQHIAELLSKGIDPKAEKELQRKEREHQALLARRQTVTFDEEAERSIRVNDTSWQ